MFVGIERYGIEWKGMEDWVQTMRIFTSIAPIPWAAEFPGA